MNKAARKSLQFTNIHLENWKNFTSVDVLLQSRVFLLGPNASGKSNFLDTLRFLKDIVAVGGGFEYAVRKQGGVSPLRSLAARYHSDIMIHSRYATVGS